MKAFLATGLAVALFATAGCSSPDVSNISHSGSVMNHIVIDDGRVGANAKDGKTAWIDASGALEIGGQSVSLTPEQRALTLQYHAQAIELHDQGVALGKSGARIAGKAISSVIKGVGTGKPDEIGPAVEGEAGAIEAQALRLCDQVGQLQATQDALAAALTPFQPYATIEENTAADCRSRQTTRN